jgi:hypothetical protein
MATAPKPKKGKYTGKQSYSPTPHEAASGAKIKGPNAYTDGALEEQSTGTATARYAD